MNLKGTKDAIGKVLDAVFSEASESGLVRDTEIESLIQRLCSQVEGASATFKQETYRTGTHNYIYINRGDFKIITMKYRNNSFQIYNPSVRDLNIPFKAVALSIDDKIKVKEKLAYTFGYCFPEQAALIDTTIAESTGLPCTQAATAARLLQEEHSKMSGRIAKLDALLPTIEALASTIGASKISLGQSVFSPSGGSYGSPVDNGVTRVIFIDGKDLTITYSPVKDNFEIRFGKISSTYSAKEVFPALGGVFARISPEQSALIDMTIAERTGRPCNTAAKEAVAIGRENAATDLYIAKVQTFDRFLESLLKDVPLDGCQLEVSKGISDVLNYSGQYRLDVTRGDNVITSVKFHSRDNEHWIDFTKVDNDHAGIDKLVANLQKAYPDQREQIATAATRYKLVNPLVENKMQPPELATPKKA